MEISHICINDCVKGLKKYNKCTKKIATLTICVLETCVLITVLVLIIYMPEKILYQLFYHFGKRKRTQIVAICCNIHMIATCSLQLFGIYKHKSWCILQWVITMILYWNINMVASVMSIVNYIVDDLEKQKEKTTQRTFILFLIQSVWLVGIVRMWYYWKTMKEINNVANLVQYVAERRGGFRLLRRQRRSSAHHEPQSSHLPTLVEEQESTTKIAETSTTQEIGR